VSALLPAELHGCAAAAKHLSQAFGLIGGYDWVDPTGSDENGARREIVSSFRLEDNHRAKQDRTGK